MTTLPSHQDLPSSVMQYIRRILRRMPYSLAQRRDVRQELTDHFQDALADCPAGQREQRAAELVAEFGDPKLLARLIRRGRKRCRPLLRRAAMRILQCIAGLFVLSVLYLVWIASGSPTLRVDYLALLNEENQPAIDESRNAWPDYAAAIEAYTGHPNAVAKPRAAEEETEEDTASEVRWEDVASLDRRVSHMEPFELSAVRDWISAQETAWQWYAAGSRKPLCRVRYTVPDGTSSPRLLQVRLPEYSRLRDLGRLGAWRARFALQEGRVEEALEDCLTVARVGRHFQKPNDVLIGQLVGLGISGLAHEQILEMAADGMLPPELLKRAQEQLEALYVGEYPLIGLATERISFHDTVQSCFTEGGLGGGHIIPRAFGGVADVWGGPGPFGGPLLSTLVAAVQAGRNETLAQGDAIYDLNEALAKKTPFQRKSNPRNADNLLLQLPRWRYALLYMTVPSLSRIGDMAYIGKAKYEATVTALAALRYRQEKGRYPSSLAELMAEGYLKQLPADPYSNGPLVYRATGDDFVLYSVAADFTDDGGAPIPDGGWEPNPRLSVGQDHVFWPPRADRAEQGPPRP